MKAFFIAMLLTYVVLFIGDYIGAKRNFSQKDCIEWMKHPWYFHLMIPGPGNYCIDSGKWPESRP